MPIEPLRARIYIGYWTCNCGQRHERWIEVSLDLTQGAEVIQKQLLAIRDLKGNRD